MDPVKLEFFLDKWDILVGLLGFGFSIALVVVVIAAGFKLGIRLWPYILVIGFLAYMFM